MLREHAHNYRERMTTSLMDGETPNSRRHHAIRKGKLIISGLLPSGNQQHQSVAELEDLIEMGGPSMRGAEVVFIAQDEKYRKVDSDGKVQNYDHGNDDGLDNRVKQTELPPLGDSWLEVGDGFRPRRVRHDWQTNPYTDPTRRY